MNEAEVSLLKDIVPSAVMEQGTNVLNLGREDYGIAFNEHFRPTL